MPSIFSISKYWFTPIFFDNPDDGITISGIVFHIHFLCDERHPLSTQEDHAVNKIFRLLEFIIDLVVPEASEHGTASKVIGLDHSREPVPDKAVFHREGLNRVKMGL